LGRPSGSAVNPATCPKRTIPHEMIPPWQRYHFASRARIIAGLCGLLTLSQSRDGPDRQGAESHFDTRPSRPILRAGYKTVGPLVTPARLAHVNISDDLPNGPHLEVNDAIQLRAGDTQVASSCSETTLGASESHFAHIDGQLGNPHADASCHRPAMPCYRFGTVRHRRPPALLVCGCLFGRVGQAMPPAVRSHSHLTGSVRTRGPDIRLAPPVQCRPGGQSLHRRRVVPMISPTYAPASSLGGYVAA
jgi:hypothetical protein